eukprot:TRINITY_DN4020_c1_g1_i1.p1 TRINITY_DN4020_c1_g1~~TRINITY_DN4020_c1_g1_i1.p1  ORF type:complete len:339 (-),score=72.03 TRINITY_DN4020_c1_g1_i1:1123-2139(-)
MFGVRPVWSCREPSGVAVARCANFCSVSNTYHSNYQYHLENKEQIKLQTKQKYKQYHLKNIEHIKQTKRLYYLKHKDNLQRQKKEYRSKNNQAIKTQQKLYRIKNEGLIKQRQKLYRLKNREQQPRKNKIWKDPGEVRKFFESASVQLYISEPQDWYRISRGQIKDVGGKGLYTAFGNLGKALQFAFPEEDWDISKFSLRRKKSAQRWLRVILEQILPEKTPIFEDYLHPDLVWDEISRHKMELDIWVPEYNLALEYQGEQHYYDLVVYGAMILYSKRDIKKKEACDEKGISLAIIPYWWDKKKESLLSTLSQIRPDIFPPPVLIGSQDSTSIHSQER